MTADFIVIGAGIIGCSVAWELSKSDCSVLVLEKNKLPTQETSSAAFGGLSAYTDPYFTGEGRDHAARGVQLYREEWIEQIQLQSRMHVTFTDLGLLKLCTTSQEFGKALQHVESLKSTKYSAEVLSVDETRRLEPNLTGLFVGAVLYDEPWVDTHEYMAALFASVASRSNVQVLFDTEVATVENISSRVIVRTVHGEQLGCRKLVICTGLFPVDIVGYKPFRMRWIRGDALAAYTKDDRPLVSRQLYMGNGFIVPRANGRMLLGYSYVEEMGLPPRSTLQHRNRIELRQLLSLIDSNTRILPLLSECEVGEVWRGWRPTAEDALPLLGPLRDSPEIVIATGHIGLGVTMAPATAESVARFCLENVDTFPGSFAPDRLQ